MITKCFYNKNKDYKLALNLEKNLSQLDEQQQLLGSYQLLIPGILLCNLRGYNEVLISETEICGADIHCVPSFLNGTNANFIQG